MGLLEFLSGHHSDNDDASTGGPWSCRGCGITNGPIRYKCLLCHTFSLCLDCHKSAAQHHTKHAPHNFALVVTPENDWECNQCGTGNAQLRAKCCKCPDYDLCFDCFDNGGVAEAHPTHPGEEDFSWSSCNNDNWECEGCGIKDGNLSFKCVSCEDLILCPKCVGSAAEHHKLHPEQSDYMPVIGLGAWWSCDGCEHTQEELIKKERASVRWDCKHCENAALCSKCFEKVEKKHKKHPLPEDFAPTLYLGI